MAITLEQLHEKRHNSTWPPRSYGNSPTMASAEPDPAAAAKTQRKLVTEFGPVVLFFLAQKAFDLMVATAVLMVACTIAVIYGRVRDKSWPVTPLVTAMIVLVMGSLTLVLQDETFIKFKPTLIYGLFAATLAVGLAFRRLLVRKVFGESLPLDDDGWRKLTIGLILVFVALAGLNEVLRQQLSTDDWVNAKTFGYPAFMLASLIGINFLLQSNMVDSDSD